MKGTFHIFIQVIKIVLKFRLFFNLKFFSTSLYNFGQFSTISKQKEAAAYLLLLFTADFLDMSNKAGRQRLSACLFLLDSYFTQINV